MKKRVFVVIGLLLVILSATFTREKKQIEKVVTVAQGAKPKSLDPHMYNEFSSMAITEHMFGTLVYLDDEGNVVPRTASSWEYITPTEIIFTIAEGIKFHNGETLTADDVEFSLNRMLEKPASRAMVIDMERAEKIDERRVKVYLKKKSAPFLSNLTTPPTAILNKKDTLKREEDGTMGIAPVGTGPFKLLSWGDGEKIVLEGFENYSEGAPKIDKLVFRLITDASSKMMALETGEIDIAYAIAPIDYQLVENNPKLQLIFKETTTTDYLGINMSKEILKDPELRKAISYAIDKKGIIEAIYLGKGTEAGSVVNPSIFGGYNNFKDQSFNPELAAKIVEEKGYKGTKLKILMSENPIRFQVAQIIQANLKEIGLDISIEMLEMGALLQRTTAGTHDLMLTTWILGVTDADTLLTPLLHSSSIGGGNRSRYSNPEFDKKLETAREEINPEKRREYYKEAQEIVTQDVPVIPLVYKMDGIGMNSNIKNFQYNKSTMRNRFEVIDREIN